MPCAARSGLSAELVDQRAVRLAPPGSPTIGTAARACRGCVARALVAHAVHLQLPRRQDGCDEATPEAGAVPVQPVSRLQVATLHERGELAPGRADRLGFCLRWGAFVD